MLAPRAAELWRRVQKCEETESKLTSGGLDLADFASGHEYFGLHFIDDGWVFREWAPNADAVFLVLDLLPQQQVDLLHIFL